MTVRVLTGDCREVLATLPDESVHMVCTSPPYWGLRCYGVDGQLGQEKTPEEHVAVMVDVFRHVRRVLRKDGTLWLNYGDCYAGSPNGRSAAAVKALGNDDRTFRDKPFGTAVGGLKPKDLVMMPARIALALQADGWWLRSEIVWAKPNPMPESITDRPTSSHEKMFLLARSARYFYDAEAVREPGAESTIERWGDNPTRKRPNGSPTQAFIPGENTCGVNPAGRNLRNVWHIATHPYPDAHFATFPPALVEPCIKAGTSEKGVCGGCGAPWVREVETTRSFESGSGRSGNPIRGKQPPVQGAGYGDIRMGPTIHSETTGWSPSCKCTGDSPAPAIVLDCFGGSGTVGLVADRLGRDAILIELSPEYADMARNRITQDAPLFAKVGT